MTRTRHLARQLVRLALPLAALVLVGTPETARADREGQRSCTYGHYYQYFDEFGNVCEAIDTCSYYSQPSGCAMYLTYYSYTEDVIVCYCDN